MHLHRFILDFVFNDEKILIKDSKIIFQIKKVLRLKTGKKLILVDKQGKEVLAKIENFRDNFLLASSLGVLESENFIAKEVNLYVSVLKKENFELICQKATEIGVASITPLICKHTVKLNLNYERLKKIIKEAAEQSGRNKIPKLFEIKEIKKIFQEINQKDLNLFFNLKAENFKNILKQISNSSKINIFIGPEGGWSDVEINLAKELNFKIISLSDLTFRAETAALIASYVAIYL
jgi:16S rRNA (uracil1498-N3)-methyltransferase